MNLTHRHPGINLSLLTGCLALLLLLMGTINRVMGQSEYADSLLKVARTTDSAEEKAKSYLELSRHYRKSSLDTSAIYIDKAIEIASSLEDQRLYHRVKISQAALFWTQGQLDDAAINYENALSFYKSVQDSFEIARCLLNLGVVNNSRGRNEEAVRYLHEAYRAAVVADEPLIQAQTVGTLASTYFIQGELDSTSYYDQRTVEIFTSLNDSANLARAYTNMGYHYRETGKSYLARPYYEKALEYLAGTDEIGLKGEVYQGLGTLEYRIGNYREATENFLLSREYFGKLGWYRKIAGNQVLVGLCFKQMGRMETAREVLEEAYHLADSVGDRGNSASALTNLADLDRAEGNYEKAISSYRKALDLGIEENGNFARYMGLGLSFRETNRVDSADYYINMAIDLARSWNNELALGSAFLIRPNLPMKKAWPRPAWAFWTPPLNIIPSINIPGD